MDDVTRRPMKRALREAMPTALDAGRSPVMAASGVVVPRDWRDAGGEKPGAPLTMTMGFTADSRRNGELLVEKVRDYVKRSRRGRSEEKAVRELHKLLRHFPTLAIAVPELAEYLRDLFRRGKRQAVGHLLCGARRGRRPEDHGYLIAMIDLVMEQEPGCRNNVAAACRELHKLPGGPFKHLTVERMRTIHSEQHEVRRALRSFHVSEDELAQVPRDLLEELFGAMTE